MNRRSIVFGFLFTFVLVIAAVGIVSAVDYSEALCGRKSCCRRTACAQDRLRKNHLSKPAGVSRRLRRTLRRHYRSE